MNRCRVKDCPGWVEGEPHHIVAVGARGNDEPYNLLDLCFYHHIREFHQHGWKWFCKKHPELEAAIVDARERQGKRV